ncbi:unnamed protein product [Clonostachys rosea]|uniref:Uncharacterized protein n=1 Tax=Bionectria ochroleuca TaxID=29856 RepID=A0ABY6UMY4_BIOOC|nr:unnamed protein product [Clonostachys rosea]
MKGSSTTESTVPGTAQGATETNIASIRNMSSSSTTQGITLTSLTAVLSRSGTLLGEPSSSLPGVWTNSSRSSPGSSSIQTFGSETGQATQAQDTSGTSIGGLGSETTHFPRAVLSVTYREQLSLHEYRKRDSWNNVLYAFAIFMVKLDHSTGLQWFRG